MNDWILTLIGEYKLAGRYSSRQIRRRSIYHKRLLIIAEKIDDSFLIIYGRDVLFVKYFSDIQFNFCITSLNEWLFVEPQKQSWFYNLIIFTFTTISYETFFSILIVFLWTYLQLCLCVNNVLCSCNLKTFPIFCLL